MWSRIDLLNHATKLICFVSMYCSPVHRDSARVLRVAESLYSKMT